MNLIGFALAALIGIALGVGGTFLYFLYLDAAQAAPEPMREETDEEAMERLFEQALGLIHHSRKKHDL